MHDLITHIYIYIYSIILIDTYVLRVAYFTSYAYVFRFNDVSYIILWCAFFFPPQKRQSIDLVASRQTSVLTWVGLGLMSVQFGILARLTWWEYSWDIMEPVTYFVTYGTAMAVYAYYVLTKQVRYNNVHANVNMS